MPDLMVVVGLGSMGKRRVRDLKALGVERVIGVDGRADRREEAASRFGVETLASLDDALSLGPEAVVVSVPPHLHYPCCLAALDCGAAYFVECLTCLTIGEIDHLIARETQAPGHAYPSVTQLMMESVEQMRQYLAQMARLYSIHAIISSWLPAQHPWEKPGEHYEFHRAKGGGLAEPAYELSWIYTVTGRRPIAVQGMARHVSDLPPGFNDMLDLLVELDNGAVLNMHYALNEQHDGGTTGRMTRFVGDKGLITLHFQQARFYSAAHRRWTEYHVPQDWDFEAAYRREMQHFLDALEGRTPYLGSLRTERDVLATLLAAEQSSDTGSRVCIDDLLQRELQGVR